MLVLPSRSSWVFNCFSIVGTDVLYSSLEVSIGDLSPGSTSIRYSLCSNQVLTRAKTLAWTGCVSLSFSPPGRSQNRGRVPRIAHLRGSHQAPLCRPALSELASKPTKYNSAKGIGGKLKSNNFNTCPLVLIQRMAKMSVPQWWNMNL